MATNLDDLTLSGDLSAVNLTGSGTLTFSGGELKVTTAAATADDTIAVSGLAVGDVVLAINATSNGAVGHPGAISAGDVACTQAASGESYIVAWIDAT